jgi:type VI secretion system protein ImpM
MPGQAVSRVKLFGKMPAHGDFVGRGLLPPEADNLDGWLIATMLHARDRVGDAFDDRYDRAPPWRFATPEAAGVLVASVDAVGRRYPLYLALNDAPAEVAEACEDLVYRAFAGAWDADRLAGEAEALAAIPGVPAKQARWWTIGGEGFAPAECFGDRPR